jgi:hypothetical protein
VGGGGANRGATLTDTRAALAVELVNFCGGSSLPFWLSGGRRMANEQWIGDDGLHGRTAFLFLSANNFFVAVGSRLRRWSRRVNCDRPRSAARVRRPGAGGSVRPRHGVRGGSSCRVATEAWRRNVPARRSARRGGLHVWWRVHRHGRPERRGGTIPATPCARLAACRAVACRCGWLQRACLTSASTTASRNTG